MTVIQLQPYLEMDEWIEATDELLAINSGDLPDGEVNWLLAIAHLNHLAKTIRGAAHKQQCSMVLQPFLRRAQANMAIAAIVGKLTTQELLLMEHLSVGVAIAHRLYPAPSMDWCTEIEMEDFGREGN
ncbi:MAG: hypothetical protein AAGA75_18630 [Cyanobacteria bacterium P01_E01_bin.6]